MGGATAEDGAREGVAQGGSRRGQSFIRQLSLVYVFVFDLC